MTDAASPLVARLLALEPVKTWSLIATVFGDAEAAQLSGKALKALLEPLGVKPEAMRVALHRLKKDGWLVSEKQGREVLYQLSEHGLQETVEARKDVYRRDAKYADGWVLALFDPDGSDDMGSLVRIDRGLSLVPSSTPLPPSAMALTINDDIRAWFEDHLVPAHVRDLARELTAAATAFDGDGEEAVQVRLMCLHLWRKMALRQGTWAHIALLPEGAMAQCQRAVLDVFDATAAMRP
ncbi:MAG: hypothetical protein AAFP28_03265 [Pseudomonadota bacterium]